MRKLVYTWGIGLALLAGIGCSTTLGPGGLDLSGRWAADRGFFNYTSFEMTLIQRGERVSGVATFARQDGSADSVSVVGSHTSSHVSISFGSFTAANPALVGTISGQLLDFDHLVLNLQDTDHTTPIPFTRK